MNISILIIYFLSSMTYVQVLFEEDFLKQSISEFIRKVYLILENKKYQQVLSWHTDNKTIVIKDNQKMQQEILPVIFKQKTLKSFIRQLNMYNFKKVKKQGETNHYLYFQNQNFIKGNIQNLIFINRKKRGYIEKTKLQDIETKTILQKYNIFVYGIFDKLRDQFSRIGQKYSGISQLSNLIKPINSPIPNIGEFTNDTAEFLHPILKQQIQFYNMFDSFQSNRALPMFKSNISINMGNQINQ